MFFVKQFIYLLFTLVGENVLFQNVAATSVIMTTARHFTNTNFSLAKVIAVNYSTNEEKAEEIASASSNDDAIINRDETADEIKNEVSVNDLLETAEELVDAAAPVAYTGQYYEIDWEFIDKNTIRVKFELLSVPKSLIDNIHFKMNTDESNILASMTIMPSSSLKSILLLEYFLFIIRPYKQHKEIVMKMDRLLLKNTTLKPYLHFENVLRLRSLIPHERYSICICYYQKNTSTKEPDLMLCQDIINDYAKFAHLKANPRHGLLFILTQYSIIIGLLVVLQSVYTMRKRRVTQIISQHLANTAHSIRTTLSSVSLVRQSFSSLDTFAEHQHHHTTNIQATQHEPTIFEENEAQHRIASSSSPMTQNHLSVPKKDGATNVEETEPFLKHVSSKNHVHFLLGPGEESDDDDNHSHGSVQNNPTTNSQVTSTSTEPYSDQADAVLSMAHILDTNKPWSRSSHQRLPI